MATIERPVGASRPADGGRAATLLGSDQGAAESRGWFAPAAGGRRAWLVDVQVAGLVGVVQVLGTIVYSANEPTRWALDAFGYGLLVVGPVALLGRRRWPRTVLLVTLLAAAGYVASGYPRGPAGFPAFGVAVLQAIVLGQQVFAWISLAAAFVAFYGLPSVVPDEAARVRSATGGAVMLAWLPVVGLGGELVRVRFERRAEQAAAERREAARRASEERLQIARELHDVLAHHISLINVQSGVALHLLEERSEQTRAALEAINEASDEALGGLRAAVEMVRGTPAEGEAGAPAGLAPRAPTSRVRDLDQLLRRTRAAGLDVQLDIVGDPVPLPGGVDLAVFRIVQEALTNVLRHAGPRARVEVCLEYAPGQLVVRVEDDGGEHAAPARERVSDGEKAGRGIPGMRQRVETLGGTFMAGALPGGGFGIRARLPVTGGRW